jgi:hypothetical protein
VPPSIALDDHPTIQELRARVAALEETVSRLICALERNPEDTLAFVNTGGRFHLVDGRLQGTPHHALPMPPTPVVDDGEPTIWDHLEAEP